MKELVFSVTKKDVEFQITKGSGPGGQHRNKVETAVRCIHRPSGAVGFAADSKSQHRNKREAFGRMARSSKFNMWLKAEVSRRMGDTAKVDKRVNMDMSEENLMVEIRDETGRWVEARCENGSIGE